MLFLVLWTIFLYFISQEAAALTAEQIAAAIDAEYSDDDKKKKKKKEKKSKQKQMTSSQDAPEVDGDDAAADAVSFEINFKFAIT